MGIFDGIENVAAEGTSSRQYYEPRNYLVNIYKVFLHEKRLGGLKLFIAETTVVESDNPTIKSGDKRNWVQSLALPSALYRIKSFIGSALQTHSPIDAAYCELVVGPQNPLAGTKVRLTCINKPTQTGKQFTQHMWGSYGERR